MEGHQKVIKNNIETAFARVHMCHTNFDKPEVHFLFEFSLSIRIIGEEGTLSPWSQVTLVTPLKL